MRQVPQLLCISLLVRCIVIIFALRRFSLAHLSRRPLKAMRSRMQVAAISSTHQLQIPMVDDRVYAQFTLKNGIPVTVVHDRSSEKSSCSLAVKTGAMYDPLPGIAHITEHAVFLGSEKYPVENAYKDFLNKNGGSSNAGTSMEHTTYKFTVNQAAFDKALDIFSQFFKGPLFSTEAMCREIMAVDSEDSKNRIIDSRRLLQVLKHQVDPDSQYAKFSTGNLKTLVYGDVEKYGENLASTIRSFHDEHYHPERMAVALVGPQPVEELQRLAEEHFSNIVVVEEPTKATRDLSSAATTLLEDVQLDRVVTRCSPLFAHGRGKLIKMRPVKDLRDLTLIWELPPTSDLYREDPCALLGYLLGHKGEGSWFAALQDKKWATSTSAGVRTTFQDFTLFEATVSLTEEGLQHWMSVMALLYKKIEAIRAASDDKLQAYWAEMRAINALDFQYKEKTSAYELAPRLAANMLEYRSDHVLSAGWMLDEHVDMGLLKQFIDKLAPDRSLVILRSKAFGEDPTSLGNDDVAFIDQTYSQYEAHCYDLAILSAGAQETPLTVVSSEDVCTADSPSDPTDALEAKKLSGQYFADLRRYHDALHQQSNAAEGGVYRTEPFYGVPYYIEDLNLELNADVFNDISDVKVSLPDANPYICSELMVDGASSNGALPSDRPLRSSQPRRCNAATTTANGSRQVADSLLRDEVWHSKDEVFRQPRSIYFHLLESPSCADGHPVLSLVSQVFSQMTARKYYQPAVAGLSYSLSIGARGVGLNFFGYTPKLAQFADTVSRDVGDLSFWTAIPPSVIVNCKDRLLRTFKSWVKERPDSQCESLMRYLLQEGTWLPQDRLNACEAIDVDYFHERVADMLQSARILSYAHGSCELSTAIDTHLQVKSNMKVPVVRDEQAQPREIPGERSRVIPPGSHQVHALEAFNPDDPNSALVTFFQADVTSPRTSALMLFLRRLLGEPAFTELRTKQQLGYIVSLSPTGYGRGWKAVRGISVRILSKRFSPVAMESSLFEFLASQRTLVHAELTEEIVRERCESIIRSLQDPPTTYSEEASDFWDSIVHDMPFDWIDQVTAELRRLDRAAVLVAAEVWMFEPRTRASVSVMIFSPEHESERQRLIGAVSSEGTAGAAVKEPQSKDSAAGALQVSYAFTAEEMTAQRDRLQFCNTINKGVK